MGGYDPFARGPHPAGVRTVHWTDARRDRTLPVEVWYPATEDHRGRDLDDATKDRFKTLPMAPEVTQDAVRDAEPLPGPLPLVVFSHGFGGDRRQTTHLCTHWASHGYRVASMDHVGNTGADMLAMATGGAPADPRAVMEGFLADRPADASFVIDRALEELDVDAGRIGISGHSFGGWTTLATTARDERIRAALPLAPAGGRTPLAPPGPSGEMAGALPLDWTRPVPVLFLVAEHDTLLPLDGMRDLMQRTPGPVRGVNLKDADHFHFCDRVEQVHDMFKVMGATIAGATAGGGGPDLTGVIAAMKGSAELCPGDHAYTLLQGLGLAHMDAHLKEDADAAGLLSRDLTSLLAERGVSIEEL
ncbi:MAG: alpha/beta hydrolase family protein [Myxococcota bacterium]